MDDESYTEGNFKRKTGAAPPDYIQCEVGVFPVFELVLAHVEWTAMHDAQLDVAVAYAKFPFWKAHRLRAVAAATTLVEHEWAIRLAQLVDYITGSRGDRNAFLVGHKKIGAAVTSCSRI